MTHDEARTYVKKHLKSGRKSRIVVSEQLVRRWWSKLNAAVFYGRLHRPDAIRVDKLRGAWGACEGIVNDKTHARRINITINETFATKKMFLDTLVHEMVHAWEHQHHTSMGHAKRFWIWKNRIKRTVGLDLSSEIRETTYLK